MAFLEVLRSVGPLVCGPSSEPSGVLEIPRLVIVQNITQLLPSRVKLVQSQIMNGLFEFITVLLTDHEGWNSDRAALTVITHVLP